MNISNQANATYNAVPPNQPGVPGSLTSNTVSTEVLSDVIKRVMTTDKTFAKEGETVHTTVTITNKGNINIKIIEIKSLDYHSNKETCFAADCKNDF